MTYLDLLEKNMFTSALTTGVTATVGLKGMTFIGEKLHQSDLMVAGYRPGSATSWTTCALFGLFSIPSTIWFWWL